MTERNDWQIEQPLHSTCLMEDLWGEELDLLPAGTEQSTSHGPGHPLEERGVENARVGELPRKGKTGLKSSPLRQNLASFQRQHRRFTSGGRDRAEIFALQTKPRILSKATPERLPKEQ